MSTCGLGPKAGIQLFSPSLYGSDHSQPSIPNSQIIKTKRIAYVVKDPTSFHLLFRREPQLGQASAFLLTLCSQSLHFFSFAKIHLPALRTIAEI